MLLQNITSMMQIVLMALATPRRGALASIIRPMQPSQPAWLDSSLIKHETCTHTHESGALLNALRK